MAVADADGSVGPVHVLDHRGGRCFFGTGMPAFKDALSSDDIWAVIAYLQARLPQIAEPTEQK
jgi:mono/diheme cytochrome c family protein